MPIPRIAIVGRPNVGKSSLLNMIAGRKASIVDSAAGTTRDRVAIIAELEAPDRFGPPRAVQVIDTGGIGVYVADGQRFNAVGDDLASLTPAIEYQIAQAVAEADLVLFAVDVQAGVLPQDREIARMLREQALGRRAGGRGHAPVQVVATKVDGPRWESHAIDLSALGFGPPLLVSAKNNYMRREFLDALYERLPAPTEDEAPPRHADLMLAIIGKRNAGKSTLVNTLAGDERVIVSEIAGTTRDAVDVRFEMDGRSLVAIDTAGLRRRKSFENRIEWWAYERAKAALDRCDVALLMIDATVETSQVDEHLAQLVRASFKPVIIVVNKWDLAQGRAGPSGKPVATGDFETYLRRELAGLAFAPVSFISASAGTNIRPTIDLAFELAEQARRRVPTGQLNRLVSDILSKRGPTSKLGHQVRVFYVAQVATNPPTIALVVSHPQLFTPGYQRYLLNRFRETLPFPEVPIRLLVRGRKRKAKGAGVAPAVEAPLDVDPESFFEE